MCLLNILHPDIVAILYSLDVWQLGLLVSVPFIHQRHLLSTGDIQPFLSPGLPGGVHSNHTCLLVRPSLDISETAH